MANEPNYCFNDIPCDDEQCDVTPTAYVGDIYYACEDHYNQFRELTAGG